jgi:hypothetical protein
MAMKKRIRVRQTLSLQDRLAAFARDIRTQAAELKPGIERDLLLKKARQPETAAHLDNWVNSPGLRPPS